MKNQLNGATLLLTAIVVKGLFVGFNLPMAILGTALISFIGVLNHFALQKQDEIKKIYLKDLKEVEDTLRERIVSLEGKISASGLVRRM